MKIQIEDGDKRKLFSGIFAAVVVIIVMLLMIPPFLEKVDTTTDKVCYETYCSKTTLDEFNKCIDLGIESVGFLSSEHFWLCDGIKVTSKCLERSEIVTERKYIGLGMRCEELNDTLRGVSE